MTPFRCWVAAFGAIASCIAPAPAAQPALLVKNGLFITVAPGHDEAFAGHMTVGADGRIIAVTAGAPPALLTADSVVDAGGAFVAPGFLSAHSHIFMSPLRGLGHTETLYGWIASFMRYTRNADADDMYWFTLHGSLDFLRNGITTAYDFVDRGIVGGIAVVPGEKAPPAVAKPAPYQENQLKAKIDAGLRSINSVWLDETGTRENAVQRLAALLAWSERNYGRNPLYLGSAISGAQQFMPTRATAELEAEMMRSHRLMNQAHFLESPEHIEEQRKKFEWYLESGAIGPNFIFGHFIQTTPDIVRRAAATGASMSWQPTSNSRLASGVADINLYRAFGMKIAVGLDDQSCTDISDPFQNLRIGLALLRTKYKDAKALSVTDMLRLHTLGSAEVLRVADKVGSLEPGKFADFLIVDPREPDTGPLHDPVATYVLACGLRNLKQVYVGGKLVADGTRMLSYDEAVVRREVDARIGRLHAQALAEETKTTALSSP